MKINIPTKLKQEIVNAFCKQYNYKSEITNTDYNDKDPNSKEYIPNPISKGQFAKNIVKSFIKEVYIANKVTPIEEQKAVAIKTADTEIDVITVE